jgi:hypothetical protein
MVLGTVRSETNTLAQKFPEHLNIPKRFENYKKKGKKTSTNLMIYEFPFYARIYDTDRDDYADVVELFLELYPNGPVLSDKPLFYTFDMNNNGKVFESGETIIDEEMDDLNGNEIFLKEYINEWFKNNEEQGYEQELQEYKDIKNII